MGWFNYWICIVFPREAIFLGYQEKKKIERENS